ncbi:MAG: tRNA (uridine(34)/cytosine(34)/5-carboxymethylaminomethyluridine(34)-2'-O)-methyltransferase TrmL [Firmicutes bacterium]|nr:tRNA (uridine(34)/cytosine(34)/5-carboxymethylaminomethyluridine(34)-2'-O)-methyltransferase TrmL [Bacillota bacterium]
MNIVLYEPEIHSNTGNIARTCAITGSTLHLIKPLGFSLDDKYLKRAGLDYWEFLDLKIYENYQEFLDANKGGNMYYLSTKGDVSYTDKEYNEKDYLVFGPETRGLPLEVMEPNWENVCKIPMGEKFRSLNLSNAVAIVLYEALRQGEFKGLK